MYGDDLLDDMQITGIWFFFYEYMWYSIYVYNLLVYRDTRLNTTILGNPAGQFR